MRKSVRKSLLFLGATVLFCAAPLSAANTIFVTVGDLNCAGTDARHPKAFTAITFSFGATVAIDVPGGSGSGRPQPSDVEVLKNFDPCTTQLIKSLARGTHIPEVVLEWQTTGTTPVVFMRIKLQEVQISSVNYSASQEGVSFNWGTMIIDFWQLRPDGTLGAHSTVTWDRRANTAM